MRPPALALLLLHLGAPLFPETVSLPPRQGTRLAPIATIQPGDRILSETPDGPFYQGRGPQPGHVGPIEVAGAEPGDTLVVSIERVAPRGRSGVSRPGPEEGPGGPPGWTLWTIDPAARTARPPGRDLSLPLKPTLGYLGLLDASSDDSPGPSGGNLAAANLQEGDQVSLPCRVRGALLSFGEGRAVPWQGTGSGLLASVEVAFSVAVQKGVAIPWARIENERSLGVLASGRSPAEATRSAREGLSAWVARDHRLDGEALRGLLATLASVASGPDGARSWSLVRLPRTALPPQAPRGIRLGEIPWTEAEPVLTPDRVVLLPLGAGSKEHGPHLLLKNDEILATYLTNRVLALRPVAALPVLPYGFYPAFLEYPGSVSLSSAVQRDAVAQICRSIARYGPRRFYVLNTGISTSRPLRETAALLEKEGILLRFCDLTRVGKATEDRVRKETYGTHADEIETSMLLYIDPSAVRMDRARADGAREQPGPLTRDPNRADAHYSPSGVFGDPTLATWEKGRAMVEAIVADLLSEIDALGAAAPPGGTALSPLE